jgi:hypothetical protein
LTAPPGFFVDLDLMLAITTSCTGPLTGPRITRRAQAAADDAYVPACTSSATPSWLFLRSFPRRFLAFRNAPDFRSRQPFPYSVAI